MSTVFVHVGQCGNQIGNEFWNIVLDDKIVSLNYATSLRKSVFQNCDGKIRSLHIDGERKVTKKLMLRGTHPSKYIDSSNVLDGRAGFGNNWALGHNGTKWHPADSRCENSLLARAMESFRKQTEKMDYFGGYVMMHSLSGGTGGGFGCRVVESLRDQYPGNYSISVAVAPHSSGESPLQHYNSLLCLASLSENVDSVVLFENDHVLKNCERFQTGAVQSNTDDPPPDRPRVSLKQMNEYVAASLARVFYPVETLLPTASKHPTGAEPWELLRTLCPMPAMKFVQLYQGSNSSSSKSTNKALNSVLHSVRSHHSPVTLSTLAYVFVARGKCVPHVLENRDSISDKIRKGLNCSLWNPFPGEVWTDGTEPCGSQASLTLATNSNVSTQFISRTVKKSRSMFENSAYLHWYEKYGCGKDVFDEAFNCLDSVLEAYDLACD